jgi:hypothetical protein
MVVITTKERKKKKNDIKVGFEKINNHIIWSRPITPKKDESG